MSNFISDCLANDVKEAIELMPSIVAVVREKNGWRGFETIENMVDYYHVEEDDGVLNDVYWSNIEGRVKYL